MSSRSDRDVHPRNARPHARFGNGHSRLEENSDSGSPNEVIPSPEILQTSVAIRPTRPSRRRMWVSLLDSQPAFCVNGCMTQKQSVLVMWLIFLVGMILGSGWVATLANLAFWAIVLIHAVEFFVKKGVMEKAGGAMGQHFVQTMIYGLFHWKPLEDEQAVAASD